VELTFLGTGTSHGVPVIGCRCAVCQSTDPRDTRSRPSILVRLDSSARILVDTSTDLRAQALARGVTRVDAILFTHSHADHIFGLDDTRRFNELQGGVIPVFGDAPTMNDLRRTFAYAFERSAVGAGGVPQLQPFVIAGRFCVCGQEVVPVPILHGTRSILGYRFGGLAYLTDCSAVPPASVSLLEGLDVLVLGALRHRPHPTHFTVAEAVAAARVIGARRTFLTHMCHDLPHVETCAALPAGITLAHDGLRLEIH
jgi:phosphoribosyl 1,2-cyclic phosphate phosphodiesterase